MNYCVRSWGPLCHGSFHRVTSESEGPAAPPASVRRGRRWRRGPGLAELRPCPAEDRHVFIIWTFWFLKCSCVWEDYLFRTKEQCLGMEDEWSELEMNKCQFSNWLCRVFECLSFSCYFLFYNYSVADHLMNQRPLRSLRSEWNVSFSALWILIYFLAVRFNYSSSKSQSLK